MQFSSEEGLPETAVKASRRPFMTAVAISQPLTKKKKKTFILLAHPAKPEKNVVTILER